MVLLFFSLTITSGAVRCLSDIFEIALVPLYYTLISLSTARLAWDTAVRVSFMSAAAI